MIPFTEWPKIARLSRPCTITEKIDGTNASVVIIHSLAPEPGALTHRSLGAAGDLSMFAGSRTQFVTPENDNHGWARWVVAHAEELFELGPGDHFGEWWGSGIQRGYGLQKGEKRFSLFNTNRWGTHRDREKYPTPEPACCHVVPVLYQGMFDTQWIEYQLKDLRETGSYASPGFMKPEGIIIYHAASGQMFKKTIEKDEQPKGQKS